MFCALAECGNDSLQEVCDDARILRVDSLRDDARRFTHFTEIAKRLGKWHLTLLIITTENGRQLSPESRWPKGNQVESQGVMAFLSKWQSQSSTVIKRD